MQSWYNFLGYNKICFLLVKLIVKGINYLKLNCMKSTILLTAITILAFNMNAGHKKPAPLQLHDVSAYIQTIAAKHNEMITGIFAPEQDTFVSHAIKANKEEIMMAQMALQKSTN